MARQVDIDAADPMLRQAMLQACQRIVRLTGAIAAGVALQRPGGDMELVAQAGLADIAPLEADTEAAPLRCGDAVVGAVLIVRAGPARQNDPDLEQLAVVAEAVSTTLELHWAGQRMRASEAQYRLLFMSNPLPMYVSRFEDRRMLAVNPSMLELYGYTEAQFLSLHSGDLLLQDDPQERARMLASTAVHRRIVGLRRQHRKSDGTPLEVEVWTDEIDFEGAPARLVLIYDVTERVRAERKLEQLAFFDTLTGLPNRALLIEELQRALEQAATGRQGGAVLLLDMDDFKRVNETWGHDEGDRLLQEVGRRLSSLVRPGLTVGRPGGDEFVVLSEGLSADSEALRAQVRTQLRELLTLLRPAYRVGAWSSSAT